MYEQDGLIRWSQKVPQSLIRRLYTQGAAGLRDDDLLSEVANRLYERCRDILIATDAYAGHAMCPRCDAVLPHDRRDRSLLQCSCGFRMRWRAYKKSMYDPHLWGGRALPQFAEYVRAYERGATGRELFLLVDRLVHAVHTTVIAEGVEGGRSAAFNVIDGTPDSLVAFLAALASAESPGEILEHRARWSSVVKRGRPQRRTRTGQP